jgi:septum formation topological specificity factor MinE
MQNDPINTAPIQQFIQQVKSADAGKAKEVRLDIQVAKRLAFTLGETMAKLNGDLEEILSKKYSKEDETIKVELDGGNSW